MTRSLMSIYTTVFAEVSAIGIALVCLKYPASITRTNGSLSLFLSSGHLISRNTYCRRLARNKIVAFVVVCFVDYYVRMFDLL